MYFTRIRITRHRRQGTIYVLVLLSSLIVSTIGLASLQLLRLQGRTATDGNDLIEARIYARTAVEIGMLKIHNDANWRKNLGNGAWVTNQTIGTGNFSVNAVDPIDNDVRNGNNHPLILTGTGVNGNTSYSTAVRLEVGPPVGSALEVSMVSGGYTFVNGATLTSDQTVASNGYYYAWSGATVNSNVEAEVVWGSQYTKSKLANAPERDLPDPSTVLDDYTANGTTISYSSLQQWTRPEMLTNTSFETDTSDWYASGSCTLQRSLSGSKQGSASLQVTDRGSSSACAAQDLTPASLALLLNGHSYNLTLPVYCGSNCTARALLTITNSSDDTQTFSSNAVSVSNNNWVNVTGVVTPTWTGTLTKATVSISFNVSHDYYMDAVTLTDVTYPLNSYVIDRQLISPTVNPFGTQTNAEGIYVINCDGQDVFIGDSRIVGTLILKNPGANSSIQRSVIWEPAIVNYPALLTDGTVEISFGSAGVSESTLSANLNPDGTPYPYLGGTANSTSIDSYPSKINGIVYSARGIIFEGAPTISGVVIADDNIVLNDGSLNLQYNNTYLNNFPPGFDLGVTSVKPVPGTWKRSVN